jgi:hypothetical protein
MMMASNMNLWTAAGLVYVLAGSALLCNALFLNPPPMQAPQAAERDPTSLQRLGRQWLDSRVGAVLIVIGFFLQTTGALGTPTLNGAGALVLLALAFCTACYAMMRDSLVDDLVVAPGLFAKANVEPAPPRAPNEVVEAPAPKVVNLRREAAD